mmetsp:Transcript_101/g.223  ORF Transcript_101/g.223 Transcript_101/m.223 type:complete len:111 (-) Transcript_101:118-450(-)
MRMGRDGVLNSTLSAANFQMQNSKFKFQIFQIFYRNPGGVIPGELGILDSKPDRARFPGSSLFSPRGPVIGTNFLCSHNAPDTFVCLFEKRNIYHLWSNDRLSSNICERA